MNSAQQNTKHITITDDCTVVTFWLRGDAIEVLHDSGCDVGAIFNGKINSSTVTEDQIFDIWSEGYDGDTAAVRVEINTEAPVFI